MQILPAKKEQARAIARLIMIAMNYDCCQYFVGAQHTLADFEDIMTVLVAAEQSQYSFVNTLTAVDEVGDVVGICVAYDGARLHSLRQAFIDIMWQRCRRDLRNMRDETAAGELYIDSLAVAEKERGKGVATALLHATISKAQQLLLPAVGLLVDADNPRAERLYTRVGFTFVDHSTWGGHPMKHLQYKIAKEK